MKAALVLLAAVTASTAAASRAPAGSTIQVHATISYSKRDGEYRRASLRITRGGVLLLSVRVQRLTAGHARLVRLLVRDLDRDGEPEIVLDLYTNGAHCCTQSLVYRYVPEENRYRHAFHDWGNASYRIVDLDHDGRPELRSADDRLAYVFTAYAASFFPVRIWHFAAGRFLDVTRRYPSVVAADAATLWNEYLRLRRDRADVRGVLAAWLADQYLIGREEDGWRRLRAAYRRGELGPTGELAGWPQGQGYLRALKAHLRRLGYAR